MLRVGKALACLLLLAPAAEGRPFTATDLATMDRVVDARIAPDGSRVAYVVRSIDPATDKPVTTIRLLPPGAKSAGRGEDIRVVGAADPSWSDDGRTLFFLAPDGGGVRQVWRTGSDGPPEQLTALPLGIQAYRVAPGGRLAVVSVRGFPDCRSIACIVQRAAAEAPVPGRLYTSLDVRFYDSWGDGRRNGLYAVRLDGASDGIALTQGFDTDVPSRPSGDETAFVISPGGDRLIFSARPSGVSQNASAVQRLYTVPLAGDAAPRELLPNLAGSHSDPTFSPDGRTLAFLDKAGAASDGDHPRLRLLDLETGSVRQIARTFDRAATEIAWSSDGKSLYGVADDNGQQRIFRFDPRRDDAAALTGDGSSYRVTAGGGRIAYLHSSFAAPAQVHLAGRDGPLTDVGLAGLADVPMAPTTSFSFAGWNGETVQGFVTAPVAVEPGRKYPVIFLIHGGPHSNYPNEWSYLRNPQVWASRGYATVMINFHGSTGFGQAFADSILGHRGDRPLEDLQKGWGAALAKFPFLDEGRACAMGSSFGGYMVDWIAGAWNEPWRCLVSHAGTFDMRALSYSGDILWHNDRQLGGSLPWEAPEAAEKHNPVNLVARWKKPILITHGGRDYRVPFDQGLAAFTAAQRLGIPSELLYFPEENHLVSGREAMIQWYDVVNAWLDRWTAP